LKSGSLNLLEPSGTVQACNGIALLFSHTNLYSLPNIIKVVKSRKIRYAGHVARTGNRRGLYRVLVGRPEGMIKTGKTWAYMG